MFSVRIAVRAYELDPLGHVNQAVYHSYAEHARTEMLRSVGLPMDAVLRTGVAPVLLTGTMKYLRELRADEEIDVSAAMSFGDGKTFHVDTVIRKADGTVSAEFTGTFGLMDLTARRLVADPKGRLAGLSSDEPAFLAAAGQSSASSSARMSS
ncbi:MAG TPA: acyl-CoA thioesterase [Pseudonocardiaceae bacterium]|nr:acyl-CoA thioesterase [Pseudonocardiaceae bacterium]